MLARATIGRILASTLLMAMLLIAISQQQSINFPGEALLSFFSDSSGGCTDFDGDGFCDGSDNCPDVPNVDQTDSDGDGIGDVCDNCLGGDTDGDGVCDGIDNCPDIPNPDQKNMDKNFPGGDEMGDVCDPDADGDGCFKEGLDWSNACGEPIKIGVDGDDEIAGDQTKDGVEEIPGDSLASGQNGCDLCPHTFESPPYGAFLDEDGDGVGTACDKCPHVSDPLQPDLDSDGIGDACDSDLDGDGCSNIYTADNGVIYNGATNQCEIQSGLAGNPDDPKPFNPAIGCVNGCRQKTQFNCGNCIVEEGEACDDGDLNTNNPPDLAKPSCREDCTLPVCSDGIANEDDVPDTWADFEDPACHEGGCADCEWRDTEYLPSKHKNEAGEDGRGEDNACILEEDGFPPVETPPVGFLRGLFQRSFSFLLAAHEEAPLWSGQGCTGQDDGSCRAHGGPNGNESNYRCAPKYQQNNAWVYECKKIGDINDSCNYNKDCESGKCLQEVGGSFGRCFDGDRPDCDPARPRSGGGGGAINAAGPGGGITNGPGATGTTAGGGECTYDIDCGEDVWGECKYVCGFENNNNAILFSENPGCPPPPGGYPCVQHLHAPFCSNSAGGICVQAQDWWYACAPTECADDPNGQNGGNGGINGGNTSAQTSAIGVFGGTIGGTGGSAGSLPPSSSRGSRSSGACVQDSDCGGVSTCAACTAGANGCESTCTIPRCITGQCTTRNAQRPCNAQSCIASSSSRASSRSSARSSSRRSSSTRTSQTGATGTTGTTATTGTTGTTGTTAGGNSSTGNGCSGNECGAGGNAVCNSQGKVCAADATVSSCFICTTGTASSRQGSNRSNTGNQCTGNECAGGGNNVCAGQGRVCQTDLNASSCFICTAGTTSAPAGSNRSTGTNRCSGNECATGGNSVCAGQGRVCRADPNASSCFVCNPGTTSSRTGSNRSTTTNQCSGNECASGGDAVCAGQGRICVADPAVSACMRCVTGGASSRQGSNRSTGANQCTGDECSLGGDVVCQGLGKVCQHTNTTPCMQCVTGSASSRQGSNRSTGTNQCAGNECALGGNAVCLGLGKTCVADPTVSACMRCVTGSASSRQGSNRSTGTNQCAGNECANGGDVVCEGLGRICVSDPAASTCIRCAPGSASSRQGSNRSASRRSVSLQCIGDECALGGNTVCAGLGKVCQTDPGASSCFVCAAGSVSSRQASNRSQSQGNLCFGNECAIGGNSVCAGLGRTCRLDTTVSACFACAAGSASSRIGSNPSAGSNRSATNSNRSNPNNCAGNECANGGNAVCAGQNRSCVRDDTQTSCIRCGSTSAASNPGSNRSTGSTRSIGQNSSRGCISDNECPSGQACVNGRCDACTQDPHCGTNRCEEGLCEECTDNSQCPAGQQCLNGKCGCTDNAQCPANQQCINGTCTGCTDNAQCPSNLCQNGQCVECFNNNQCPSGVCQSGFCVPPVCGNGQVERGEFCDDGNQINGDACANDCRKGVNQGCTDNAQCATNLCENGRCRDCTADVQCGEGRICVSGSCFSAQQLANQSSFCGNRRIDTGEECDLGDQNSLTPNAFCRPDCRLGRCGDGILDTPLELCDDGNNLAQDGCDILCRPERLAPSNLPATIINLPFMPLDASTAGGTAGTIGGSSTIAPQTPTPGTTPGTGPATVAVMSAGAAAGYAYMRRRRMK